MVSKPRNRDRNAWVSRHDMRIFRRATLASSFRTCTLIAPPTRSIASARSAFTGSPDATWMRTLVSKKLSGIRLLPVELEIGRKSPSEGAQPLQQFRASGLARDGKFPCVGDMDLDLIAFLEPERRDRGGRKAHGQAIAPFGDPHMVPHGYTLTNMYIPTERRSRRARPMSGPSPAQVRPKSRSWSFDFGR